MGDKKEKKTWMGLAPLMGWPTDKDEAKKQWKDLRANMATYYDQMREIQDVVIEARKDAWNKIFPKLMEIEDKITESLPDEVHAVPGVPATAINPKKYMGKLKEFQEMANEHAVEQADTAVNFYKEGQQQVKEAVSETLDTIEEKLD